MSSFYTFYYLKILPLKYFKTLSYSGCINFNFYSTNYKNFKWQSVVGLEIHAQINTNSKLFSGSINKFGYPPNTCVSFFDAAFPGTLPVINKKCIEAGIKTALALNCTINSVSMFDRKHYFYADMPAGYQITQQRKPLAYNGLVSFPLLLSGSKNKFKKKSSKLRQLQLEQDSGKSLHDSKEKRSLVDLNRAGSPLMELVFDPDLSDGEEAAALVKEIILILRNIDTCSCKMEEGALRVDANVSINLLGEELGTRTEIKNIGSVRGVAQAITYEIARQKEILESNGLIINETRSWDADTKTTIVMRDKEAQQDYRFMPEPNLPPLYLNTQKVKANNSESICIDEIKLTIPELPDEVRQKLSINYGLSPDICVILVNDSKLLHYFNEILKITENVKPKQIANILINELLTVCNKHNIDVDECEISPKNLAELIQNLQNNKININIARLVLQEMYENPKKSPIKIIEEKNLQQINCLEEIQTLCQKCIEKNPKMVAKYYEENKKILFAFAGIIAIETNQRANMSKVIETLQQILGKNKEKF